MAFYLKLLTLLKAGGDRTSVRILDHFRQRAMPVLLVVLGVLVFMVFLGRFRAGNTPGPYGVSFAVGAVGAAGMGMVILLFAGFQAIAGTLFRDVGMAGGAFMLGLVLGAIAMERLASGPGLRSQGRLQRGRGSCGGSDCPYDATSVFRFCHDGIFCPLRPHGCCCGRVLAGGFPFLFPTDRGRTGNMGSLWRRVGRTGIRRAHPALSGHKRYGHGSGCADPPCRDVPGPWTGSISPGDSIGCVATSHTGPTP